MQNKFFMQAVWVEEVGNKDLSGAASRVDNYLFQFEAFPSCGRSLMENVFMHLCLSLRVEQWSHISGPTAPQT